MNTDAKIEKFNVLAERAQDERSAVTNPFSTRAVFDRIAKRLEATFDLNPFTPEEPNIETLQNFVVAELDKSSLSDRFKRQVQTAVRGIPDVDSLLMWISSHATNAHYRN